MAAVFLDRLVALPGRAKPKATPGNLATQATGSVVPARALLLAQVLGRSAPNRPGFPPHHLHVAAAAPTIPSRTPCCFLPLPPCCPAATACSMRRLTRRLPPKTFSKQHPPPQLHATIAMMASLHVAQGPLPTCLLPLRAQECESWGSTPICQLSYFTISEVNPGDDELNTRVRWFQVRSAGLLALRLGLGPAIASLF